MGDISPHGTLTKYKLYRAKLVTKMTFSDSTLHKVSHPMTCVNLTFNTNYAVKPNFILLKFLIRIKTPFLILVLATPSFTL